VILLAAAAAFALRIPTEPRRRMVSTLPVA